MSGGFRSTVWDPSLIISQIVAVQAAFYFALGLLVLLVQLGSSLTAPTLFNVFSYKAISFEDAQGILAITCYVINAFVGSVWLWVVVRRTKQCLDFTVTCYFIHFVMCLAYNVSLPSTVSWWILNVAAIAIMCVGGEFLCLRTELQDIPLLGAKVDL